MSDTLNDRQRAYLLTLYNFDQTAEHINKSAWLHGEKPRPAAEWRWIEYGPRDLPKLFLYDPPLRGALKEKGLVDKGAGSTWDTLASRGLITRRYKPLRIDRWNGETMFVQLTRKGRALARDINGETPKQKQKSSELSKGAWRVLAHAYRTWPKSVFLYDVWHESNLRVPEPIVASSIGKNLLRRGFVEGDWDTFTISENGRQFFEHERAHYQELYPDINTDH